MNILFNEYFQDKLSFRISNYINNVEVKIIDFNSKQCEIKSEFFNRFMFSDKTCTR